MDTTDDLQGERDRLRALAEDRLDALGRADDATVALRDAAHEAVEAGMSKEEAAHIAGVPRAWLGE